MNINDYKKAQLAEIGVDTDASDDSSGGGQLLGRVRSYLLWDNSGSGKNLGSTYSWLGDPVDNNPMHNIVIDHAVYPTVVFNCFVGMTEDGTTSLGTFEMQVWDATNNRTCLYQQAILAGSQWRGIPQVSRVWTPPEGISAGEIEYRFHCKTSIGGLEIRGAKVDNGSYTADYEQVAGFEAWAA